MANNNNKKNTTDNTDTPIAVPATPVADKETGFAESDTVAVAPKETEGLRQLSFDEATNLVTALNNVVGYQRGVTYRHDFETGIEVLRSFGFSYNEEQADVQATNIQNEVLGNEATDLNTSNGGKESEY